MDDSSVKKIGVQVYRYRYLVQRLSVPQEIGTLHKKEISFSLLCSCIIMPCVLFPVGIPGEFNFYMYVPPYVPVCTCTGNVFWPIKIKLICQKEKLAKTDKIQKKIQSHQFAITNRARAVPAFCSKHG